MTGRLIQLSGVIVDHIYWVKTVPRAGQEATVLRSSLAAGGGFNAMVTARRAGMAVAYGGTLGTGPFSEIAAQAMSAEGISVLRPRLSAMDQGCCTVLVDAKGERSFIAADGADGQVTAADLAGISFGRDDWFLLSGYALGYRGSRDALASWLLTVQPQKLIFDPAPLVASIPAPVRDAALKTALWVSANAAEAQVLTGLSDPAVAAEALAMGRPAGGGAAVRDGTNGCFVAQDSSAAVHLPGHAVKAIDTNGAGDAHIGAFIAALDRGATAQDAAHFANVTAALSTTQEGPSTAPTLAKVLAAIAAEQTFPTQQRRRP